MKTKEQIEQEILALNSEIEKLTAELRDLAFELADCEHEYTRGLIKEKKERYYKLVNQKQAFLLVLE